MCVCTHVYIGMPLCVYNQTHELILMPSVSALQDACSLPLSIFVIPFSDREGFLYPQYPYGFIQSSDVQKVISKC